MRSIARPATGTTAYAGSYSSCAAHGPALSLSTPAARRAARLVLGAVLLGAAATVGAAPTATAAPYPAPSAFTAVAVADSVGTATVPTEVSTRITDHVTDDAGLLNASTAQAAVDKLAEDGVGLWIVTMRDDSQTASQYAAKAWNASGLGTTDLLLVINMPADGNNTFAFGGSADDSVWSDSKLDSVRSDIQKALVSKDYDGAVTVIADAAGSSGSGGSGLVLGLAAVGAGTVGVVAYSRSRKRKQGSGRAVQPAESLDQLRTRAGATLVSTDDTVRSAAEELSYAQAQFGLSATDEFTAALAAAQEHVAGAFELRGRLDNAPGDEAEQRRLCQEILSHCAEATAAIQAHEAAFKERRGIEENLPRSIAETAQRADEAEQAITAADTLLVTLHATYPASALSSISEAPARARKLVEAGRAALEQARNSAESGKQSTAVEQVRIAQASIAQATELAGQVRGVRERLERASADLDAAIASISADLVDAQRLAGQLPGASLQPLVADAEAAVAEGRAAAGPDGDPLAALDHLARAESALDAALAPARAKEENDSRARATLVSRLGRLNSQISAVTSYITSYRGAVGSSARTALAEASRHAAAATSLQTTDPTAALAEVASGESLVAQAQAQAEADVRNSSSWGSGSGGSSSQGGIDLGSLVLGGILLGGGRNYGGWGGGPRPPRPPRGGGFGGGFGGPRGGGFGGGGGSFGGGRGGGFGGGGGRF
ncbi:TLP18.3, Psb32 and MOLO-1 founding protein of phosphatase [Actinomyces ruminicola]|uniref:TLP18.3, Psb32 and MOLO-1 founding protein of phosphatase n=1 Tax=Actinomyces ruminicola TaxID=332524 RepID=A0A1H0E7C2_9ACTO|nr:TLP18.3, Psb32 and MOLO-1 founding protein of phosphatase [Actinomyces ruminicola]